MIFLRFPLLLHHLSLDDSQPIVIKERNLDQSILKSDWNTDRHDFLHDLTVGLKSVFVKVMLRFFMITTSDITTLIACETVVPECSSGCS